MIGKSLWLSSGASALCAVALHHFVAMNSNLTSRDRTESIMLRMNTSYTPLNVIQLDENNLSNGRGSLQG